MTARHEVVELHLLVRKESEYVRPVDISGVSQPLTWSGIKSGLRMTRGPGALANLLEIRHHVSGGDRAFVL